MATEAVDLDLDDLYPYPGVTRSKVWSYFGFRKKRDGPPCKNNLQMETIICKLCKKTYAYKGKFSVTCHRAQHVQSRIFLTLKLIILALFYLGITNILQFYLEKHHRRFNLECKKSC